MYSDEIGKNMGLRLSRLLGQTIVNNCMPGASYVDVMEKITTSTFKSNTTLIILVGRRGNANKRSIRKYFSSLNSLPNVIKIILFAFPFCRSTTDTDNNDNKIRHDLNCILHTMTCRHSDKFHFIDTNICISKYFYLTKDRYFLSKYYIRQVAELLSYYIINSAILFARPTTAPSERDSFNTDIGIDNLN